MGKWWPTSQLHTTRCPLPPCLSTLCYRTSKLYEQLRIGLRKVMFQKHPVYTLLMFPLFINIVLPHYHDKWAVEDYLALRCTLLANSHRHIWYVIRHNITSNNIANMSPTYISTLLPHFQTKGAAGISSTKVAPNTDFWLKNLVFCYHIAYLDEQQRINWPV